MICGIFVVEKMQLSPDNKTLVQVKDNDIDTKGVFHIPAGVTIIGENAFEHCIKLRQLTIPNGVISIERWAFYGCTKLQLLIIPGSVKSMGDKVFSGCLDLQHIVINSINKADSEHISSLLPNWFKTKVITKNLFDQITCCRDKQLARLVTIPQINQLYRFFNYNTKFESRVKINNKEEQVIEKDCSKLPDDIFWHINEQGLSDNPYYKKAKILMEREPWPTSEDELNDYKIRLKNIINQCSERALEASLHCFSKPEELQLLT